IINSFFNGWLDLANDPQSMAARQSLSSTAVELTDRMKRIYNALVVMREDINVQISNIPDEINRISSEIADLNVAIRKVEVSGQTANDLRDKRDLLVDELTKYADVRMIEREDGTAMILVGNNVVVERETSSTLSVKSAPINDEGLTRTVIVAEDGSEYKPTRGELGALLNLRDTIIITLMGELNTLAEGIVETINTTHAAGYGLDGVSGRNFFDPDLVRAYNISLSEDISDLTHIAVSGDGTPGDNANALNINNLKTVKVIDGFTINEYYNSLISDLGVLARDAHDGRMNQELLITQIDNARETVKGVSIDEEMVLMIQAQRIYQSASRMIVVVDQLLEEVINLK
ncbi:flagellar hook-associated protein FlgK, partial [Candidatus Latescibacterota bacterium]